MLDQSIIRWPGILNFVPYSAPFVNQLIRIFFVVFKSAFITFWDWLCPTNESENHSSTSPLISIFFLRDWPQRVNFQFFCLVGCKYRCSPSLLFSLMTHECGSTFDIDVLTKFADDTLQAWFAGVMTMTIYTRSPSWWPGVSVCSGRQRIGQYFDPMRAAWGRLKSPSFMRGPLLVTRFPGHAQTPDRTHSITPVHL